MFKHVSNTFKYCRHLVHFQNNACVLAKQYTSELPVIDIYESVVA